MHCFGSVACNFETRLQTLLPNSHSSSYIVSVAITVHTIGHVLWPLAKEVVMKPMSDSVDQPIRILLVDDQVIVREGLSLILESQPGLPWSVTRQAARKQ